MSNYKLEIRTEEEALQIEMDLRTIWNLMICGTDTVLVTRRSQECLELSRWIFEAHQGAVSLCHFHYRQPKMDPIKFAQGRYLVAAFSALLEIQYPLLISKYRNMLSNLEVLEVLNVKMASQYAAQVLGPDTAMDSVRATA